MFAAIAIGDLFAAGEVAFIMAIGALLEDATTNRAKKGIETVDQTCSNERAQTNRRERGNDTGGGNQAGRYFALFCQVKRFRLTEQS